MLKKNIEYWAIEVTDGERSSHIAECFDTFEEAKANVMNHTDWYCMPGCCTVVHFGTKDGRVQELDRVNFWQGKESHTRSLSDFDDVFGDEDTEDEFDQF